MLKLTKLSPLGVEQYALDNLLELLKSIPLIDVQHITLDDNAIDFTVHVRVRDGGKEYLIGCEVKSSGQPRYAEAALLRLLEWKRKMPSTSTVVFAAPYISNTVRSMCSERDVGYLDLSGNCLITFGPVYIERSVANPPSSVHRELKSLYKPKSARVLRLLLREPSHQWKLKDLSEASGVSIGHVSNVRNALRDRKWIAEENTGTRLVCPGALLDEWRVNYEVDGDSFEFYTTLHGSSLKKATVGNLNSDTSQGPIAVFASYSAAEWIAPYGRTGKSYFYADPAGLEKLVRILGLTSPKAGANIRITIPKDEGVLLDAEEPTPGVVCTSKIQTYLDLYASGERGQESAGHLREQKLEW